MCGAEGAVRTGSAIGSGDFDEGTGDKDEGIVIEGGATLVDGEAIGETLSNPPIGGKGTDSWLSKLSIWGEVITKCQNSDFGRFNDNFIRISKMVFLRFCNYKSIRISNR